MRPLGVFCEPVQLALPQTNKQNQSVSKGNLGGLSLSSSTFARNDEALIFAVSNLHRKQWHGVGSVLRQVTTNIAQLPRQSDGCSQFHSWKPCVSAQTCWNHRFVCGCACDMSKEVHTNPVFQKLYGHTSSIVKSPGPGRLCRQWHTDVEAKLQCASPDISCTGILRRASAMNLTLLISPGHWHLKPVIFGCLVRVPLCSNVRKIFLGPRVVNIWFHNITWRPSQAWYPFTSLYGLTARSAWGSWATDISYATPRIYSFWALGPKHELHANQ